MCLFTLTNDTFSKRGTFQSGQSQIPNLDGAGGARDEDVVTLQVPVDDGGRPRVQEVEPFQDLEAPALQQLQLHLLESLQVAVNQQRRTRSRQALPKQIKTLEKVPESSKQDKRELASRIILKRSDLCLKLEIVT